MSSHAPPTNPALTVPSRYQLLSPTCTSFTNLLSPCFWLSFHPLCLLCTPTMPNNKTDCLTFCGIISSEVLKVVYVPPQTYTLWNGHFSVETRTNAPKLPQYTQKTIIYKLRAIMNLYWTTHFWPCVWDPDCDSAVSFFTPLGKSRWLSDAICLHKFASRVVRCHEIHVLSMPLFLAMTIQQETALAFHASGQLPEV